MAYVITEPGIDVKDRLCVNVCSADCIYEDGVEDRQLYNNPHECIDSDACEPECPVAAIFAEEEVPTKWQHFTTLNALYFEDKQTAQAEINQLFANSWAT